MVWKKFHGLPFISHYLYFKSSSASPSRHELAIWFGLVGEVDSQVENAHLKFFRLSFCTGEMLKLLGSCD